MTMLVAWVAFPVLLVALTLGCGLLLQRAAGSTLPQPLLLPGGFIVLSLAVLFPHMSDSTAGLATPLAVILAIAGFAVTFPPRRPRLDPWWIVAGIGVFLVFGAPVILSGRATFAGFIKLDDTANYMAMIDRALHHGYNASGLAPSTYEALLSTMYVVGYPLGSFLPLGVGSVLVHTDPLWLWQPYLTFFAALIGLTLYQLASTLVASRKLRALVAFFGAQAALIYGYAQWGGIKELSTAFVVLFLAALAPTAVREEHWRRLVPVAVASAGCIAILTVAGSAWLGPILVIAIVLVVREQGWPIAVRKASIFVGLVAALSIPTLATASGWLKQYSGVYTSATRFGNLFGRIDPLQVFGIWPVNDFRLHPVDSGPTYLLDSLVAVALVAGVVIAWRRRSWAVLGAVGAAAFAIAIYVGAGSPWIGGKAWASSSPIVLGVALMAVAVVFESGRTVEAAVFAVLIAGGVVWSNVLQYHSVALAPSGRLSELETIGHRFANQGPALLTEYEEYGSRHFLRTLDAESPSELRRHLIFLRTSFGDPPDFSPADSGITPDIDEIQLATVLSYRTLVVRRSGVGSRPPSAYRLVWSGRYYDVWQQTPGARPILEHLSLGSRAQPAAVPDCSQVRRLGRLAASKGGTLATVERPPAIVIEPTGQVGAPTSFGTNGEDPGAVILSRSTTFALSFRAPSSGTYGVWVSGSFRSGLEALVDGRKVGSARDQLTWPLNFIELGQIALARGPHLLTIHYDGPDWRPGSAGVQPGFGIGPFAVAEGTEARPITYLKPSRARSLCGKSLDWVEALGR